MNCLFHPDWWYRFGLQIRNRRKRHWNPIPRLVEETGLTVDDWHRLERGALRLTQRTVVTVSAAVGLALDEVFTRNDTDFYSFIKATWCDDPEALRDDEARELFVLYKEVVKFRREHAQATDKKKRK
jgi:hypothetical protein